MSGKYLVSGLALLGALALGCGDDPASPAVDPDGGPEEGDTSSEQAVIKGRVTDVTGAPLKDVDVVAAGGTKGRTDERGRFQVTVAAKGDTRIAVESEKYSGAALSVRADKEASAQVELSVKSRSTLMLVDAEKGGRVQDDDGFAVELPAGGLKDSADKPVTGAVEVRYATIKNASDVSAAPGRMQTSTEKGLDGYGFVEVRFYKDGQRVILAKQMRVEIPLQAGSELKEGQQVDLYGLGKGDGRWKATSKAQVSANKVVVDTMQDDWLGAAQETPVDSCVNGRLGIMPKGALQSAMVANTTLRAARARGLSLVQAESGEDGSFCLPVSPNDDWHVTTFYDDGKESYELAVDLRSSDAAGMCGGTGCKSVGDVALPSLE